MRIRTMAPLAVLFVGLTALGCQSSDEAGAMDEATTEQPAAEQMNDDGMGEDAMGEDAMGEDAMGEAAADSTESDSAMMEEDGGAMEE